VWGKGAKRKNGNLPQLAAVMASRAPGIEAGKGEGRGGNQS